MASFPPTQMNIELKIAVILLLPGTIRIYVLHQIMMHGDKYEKTS